MIDLETAFENAAVTKSLDLVGFEPTLNDIFPSDLKGMEKLASLCSSKPQRMIATVTGRGEVFFSVDPDDVRKNASLEDIEFLVKFGIFYNRLENVFYMYT